MLWHRREHENYFSEHAHVFGKAPYNSCASYSTHLAHVAYAAWPACLQYLACPVYPAHATCPAHPASPEYLACPTRPAHVAIST